MSPHRRPSRPADRAQTGIDFVAGMGVFLLTVGFVVAFVPGMLAPFGDRPADTLLADRVADELAGDALATAPGAATLDTGCTIAFFGAGPDTGCSFAAAGPPADWLAVPSPYHLNVTVERDVADSPGREVLCADGGAVAPCDGSGTPLALGDPAPEIGASVATSSRVATVDGRVVVVVTRLW